MLHGHLLAKRLDLDRHASDALWIERFHTRKQLCILDTKVGELDAGGIQLRQVLAGEMPVERFKKLLHMLATLARRLLEIAEACERAPGKLRRTASRRTDRGREPVVAELGKAIVNW